MGWLKVTCTIERSSYCYRLENKDLNFTHSNIGDQIFCRLNDQEVKELTLTSKAFSLPFIENGTRYESAPSDRWYVRNGNSEIFLELVEVSEQDMQRYINPNCGG